MKKSNVYELTRLWIKDGNANSESYLIGNTLKLLDKISFAEIQA